MFQILGPSFVGIFVIASMIYVYKFRGAVRYAGVGEYLRKGWPLFTPLNCLLYMFSQKRARQPIMNLADYPELRPIQDNWITIRDELLEIHKKEYFNKTKQPDSAAYYDIGFRTFYKYGWSKFYVLWYGQKIRSAQEHCPKTVEILSQIPLVNGAMFSYLPPGSQLTRHLDPLACSLRYHLGLSTPNSDKCFINVDGQTYSWRDGESLLFDETFLHYAKNDTDSDRLILMCDIDRPTFLLGSIFNFFIKLLAKLTVVPNLEGDSRGLVNRIFAGVSPVLTWSKSLKTRNRPAYLILKYTVNFTLIGLVCFLVWLLFQAASSLF